MSWITLTETDVLEKMAAAELEACREMALAENQSDPLDGVIAEVTQEVRGYVGTKYTLSFGDTIPVKLRGPALVLIRDRLLSRFPVQINTNEDRAKQTEAALTLLRDVAAGKFLIDLADSAITGEMASHAPVELVRSSRQNFTRDSMNGL
ncbi:MAG: phage protein Gp36 family protein [Opitutaceae bacterium]|jgi:phage gp36-like protein